MNTQADSIHSEILVSSASILCAVIVCDSASVFYPVAISWLFLAPWYLVTWSGLSSATPAGLFRQPINSLPRETDFTRFRLVLPDCVFLRKGVRRRPEGIPEMGSNLLPTSRRRVPKCADSWGSSVFTFYITPGEKLLTDYKLIV